MYGWLVLLHVVGAFVFVLGHGASMVVAFRLRGQRHPDRIRELLMASQSGIGLSYLGLLILIVAGVAAGFVGGHWGRLWIWAAVAILIGIMVVMYAVASPHYGRLRAAAGVPGYEEQAAEFDPPVDSSELPRLVDSRRPFALAVVGGSGLLAIVYLMVAKPL